MKRFLLGILLLGTLIGCGSKEEKTNVASKEKKEKTIIVAQAGKPKSLDPYMYNEIPGLFVDKQIFNSLLSTDDKGNIIPELAEKFEYVNDKEIKFQLKKGVKFHNGEELKSQDVLFSVNRMKEKAGSKVMVGDIDKVEIIDDYNFSIKLNKPSSAILFTLAHPLTSILNEKDTMDKKGDITISPVGTGPFKFVSWGDGEKIQLVANENYFKGKPAIDKLTFSSIPEGSSRVAALEAGEIDIAVGIAPVDNQTISGNSKLTLVSEPTTSTEFISLSQKKPELQIREVRQAINYAIDKQSIIDSIYLGAGKVANTIVNPQVFGSYQDIKGIEYNPEKAKELLKSVGKDKGLKFKIWTNDTAVRVQSAQIIQANLKEVGIESEIETLEWGAYLQRSALGEHDLLLGGWISGTSDSDIVLYPLIHTESAGAGGNRAYYSNKEVDKLIEEGRMVTDPEGRKEAYKKVQIILATEMPVVPLFYKNENIGLSKKVKNFKYSATTMHSLYSLDKED